MSTGRTTGRVVRLQRERSRLQAAADAFLAQPDLAPTSRRSYAQTTRRLLAALGADHEVGELDPNRVEFVFRQTWSRVAPATWNRHLAALGSFAEFCRRRGWLVVDLVAGLERRPEKADQTRVASVLELERLWSRDDVTLRERCLWRLLYETAGRADEVLSLNVEDVDAANKWAVVISKGSDREFLHFQTGSARLLPRLIAGRRRGSSWPTVRPLPAGRRRPPTSARRPAGPGSPTAAPRSCSRPPAAAAPCTTCAEPRSPTWARRTSPCPCSWPRAGTRTCAPYSATSGPARTRSPR